MATLYRVYTDLLLIHSTFLFAVIASNNFITDFTFSRKQCMSHALLFFLPTIQLCYLVR